MNIENIGSSAARLVPQPTSSPPAASKQTGPAIAAQEKLSAPAAAANETASEKSQKNLTEAVKNLSSFISAIRPELSFTVDETSGTRIVQVIDTQTKDVIRQFPSEEAIQLAQALDKLQGLFVRDQA